MNKSNPDVYLLAAKRIGIPPEECTVFEDITTGTAVLKRVVSQPVQYLTKQTPMKQMRLNNCLTIILRGGKNCCSDKKKWNLAFLLSPIFYYLIFLYCVFVFIKPEKLSTFPLK